MRVKICVAVSYALPSIVLAGPMSAAAQQPIEAQNIEWCYSGEKTASDDLQIGACTALIQSGRLSAANSQAAFNNRGGAYKNKKDYDRAIADYNEAISLNPDDAVAFNERCWARAISGRELQVALADCNKSLQLEANDANTLDSRGFTYLRLGQLQSAIGDYSATLKIEPDSAASLYGRGLAKRRSEDVAGAERDIAAAKAIKPDIDVEFAGYGVK